MFLRVERSLLLTLRECQHTVISRLSEKGDNEGKVSAPSIRSYRIQVSSVREGWPPGRRSSSLSLWVRKLSEAGLPLLSTDLRWGTDFAIIPRWRTQPWGFFSTNPSLLFCCESSLFFFSGIENIVMVDNLTNVYAKFILREEEIPTGCAIVCCFETF